MDPNLLLDNNNSMNIDEKTKKKLEMLKNNKTNCENTNKMDDFEYNSASDDESKMDAENDSRASVSKDNTTSKRELYKPSDKQPFYVNVHDKQGDIDPFDLGMKLKQFKIEKIDSIKKISINKVRVTLNDWKNANKMIKLNDFAAMEKYELFIPSSYVLTEGIVRNIPTYLSIDEIRQNIKSSAVVTDVYRLNYWNFTSKQSLPSTTVKITFRSSKVPDEVYIYYVATKVATFIPKPLFCQNCLSYGHFKKYCKVTYSLCKTCTGVTHDENISCEKKCKQCPLPDNKSHQSYDKSCPEFKRQFKIKETMTVNKITFNEAKLKIQRENPTPAESNQTLKKSFVDILKKNTIQSGPVASDINPGQSTIKDTPVPDPRDVFITQITNIIRRIISNQADGPGDMDLAIIDLKTSMQHFGLCNNLTAIPLSTPCQTTSTSCN